jgi:hypothetical protein
MELLVLILDGTTIEGDEITTGEIDCTTLNATDVNATGSLIHPIFLLITWIKILMLILHFGQTYGFLNNITIIHIGLFKSI